MIQQRARRVCQRGRRYAEGTLVCLCVLGLVPAVHGQADRLSEQISNLKDDDVRVRINAVNALGEIKDPRAVEPLVTALRDSDGNVCSGAARALGKIGSPAVGPLITAIKDSDPRVRMWPASALGQIGAPAVEPLIAALGGRDMNLRGWVAYALSKIGAPAVEPLIAAIKGSDRLVGSGAAHALGEIKDPRAVQFLLGALTARDTAVISGAIAFFVARGEPDSEDALIEALDKSGDTGAAHVLLNSGNPKLEAAARGWAARNGYRITSLPGGGGPRWRGGR